METQSTVEQHYHREALYDTIIRKLQEAGIASATRKDIAGVDEFHIRGVAVTQELAAAAGFKPGDTVLDVGCGLGGPCRLFADEYGCNVTGVDLTEEFITTAQKLTELVNPQLNIKFIQADALNLPFADDSFDFVWTQHVQMNIADKEKFYVEIHRVLKPGGKFIYYDVLAKNNEPLIYPVPWANDASISFLISAKDLDALLRKKGFNKIQTKDHTPASIEFFVQLFDKMSKGEMPKMGLPILIGATSKEKFQNLYQNLLQQRIEIESGIYAKQ